MKTYQIKTELFNEIVNNINFDDLWQDILDNEEKITGGQLLPRLAGGLSNYVWTATKIEIHDIGFKKGSEVLDNSFKIIPEVAIEQNMSKETIKEKLEVENKNILNYINSDYGKCLKISMVEKLCGVPKNTIQNIANGHRKMSVKNVRRIVDIFKIFGYKPIYDWCDIINMNG